MRPACERCRGATVKVRFAVSPGPGPYDSGRFGAFVDGLEAGGFDTMWLSDIPLGDEVEPIVGLALAAERTARLMLGANLVPIGRSPVQLAKQLVQLQEAPGGRILLSLVPGTGSAPERAALGLGRASRSAAFEAAVAALRRAWDTGAGGARRPLELWLGGHGPRALERAGRLGDGWLGAAMTPEEAAAAVARITAAAASAGRWIDPEHFGMSIPYARDDPGPGAFEALASRRPDADPRELLPVGSKAVHRLLDGYLEAGCSKFVLRPVGVVDLDDELDWLARTVLPRQS